MPTLTLITGGARSGKSAHAIALATADTTIARRYFIAPATGLDDEMRARIAPHQATRPPATVDPSGASNSSDISVRDCLTLWVSNLMAAGLNDATILSRADTLAMVLRQSSSHFVVVTDEVGWGIVPDHPVARRFRDLLGWTNQKIAQVADEVLLMVAGYPLRLK
jgi:adenosyl cobinamide kinase/adenosyl cobinamide phosphate guanylyltransferase